MVASGSPASAQGASEGFLFAGQKESRVHPSIKAASKTAAVSHTVAVLRRPLECKKLYKRLRFSPTPKKGCGEKRRGFSPRGAPQAPRGAGRGMAGTSHAVKPCIKQQQPAQALAYFFPCRKGLRGARSPPDAGTRDRQMRVNEITRGGIRRARGRGRSRYRRRRRSRGGSRRGRSAWCRGRIRWECGGADSVWGRRCRRGS